MAYNGCTVIDMDAHIRERADKCFKDYIDPEYRQPFNLLCEAIARQEAKGEPYALFGSTSAVIEKIEAGRALGVRDTFGVTARSEMEHGRTAFPPGRKDHGPNLKRMPREVLAEGRYFHGFDTWERSIEFCVEELGEDMWLFASDWPHGDTAWPEAVSQIADRPRLTESAKKKLLGENALRPCPRLRG